MESSIAMSHFSEINEELNQKRDNAVVHDGYRVIRDKNGKIVDVIRKSNVQYIKMNPSDRG
jgi:hypothetical protein